MLTGGARGPRGPGLGCGGEKRWGEGGAGRAGEGASTGPASPGRKAPRPWGEARIARIATAAATALIVALGRQTPRAVLAASRYKYATRRSPLGSPEPFREV